MALAIISALGGITAFLLGLLAIARAISRQVSATTDNTKALEKLSRKIDEMDGTVGQHGERIARLEGWKATGGRTR